MAAPAMAFVPCYEPEITRKAVELPEDPMQNSFYYRVDIDGNRLVSDTYVLFISPDAAIRHLSSRGGLQIRRWEELLPLGRHTDIFLPLLSHRGSRPQRSFELAIADALENGEAAVRGPLGQFLETVVVERYNTGCENGRLFKDASGVVFLKVVDGIA
jgi:hypothetical protein